MPPADGVSQTVENGATRKCKGSVPTANVLQYRVVKEHHRHRWLRQERLLEITFTHIHNCNPPKRHGEPPKITKRFLLTSITMIGIRGKKAFSLHVKNDHAYYYSTPRAISIALKIQRYVAAASAVEVLLEDGDGRKSLLMEQLVTWAIPLPGTQRGQGETVHIQEKVQLTKLRCAINKAFRDGTVNGSNELRHLTRALRGKREGSEKDLFELRSTMDVVRDLCTNDVMKQCDLPRRGASHSDILMCVEDIIQRLVIRPNFERIVSFLRQDEALEERETLFNSQRELLRGKSADVFGVPDDLRALNYDLVLRHFDLLTCLKSPNDLLDQVVNIVACIYLTVHVAANLPCPSAKRFRRDSAVGERRGGSPVQHVEPSLPSLLHSPSPPPPPPLLPSLSFLILSSSSSSLLDGAGVPTGLEHAVLPGSHLQLRPAHKGSPTEKISTSPPIILSLESRPPPQLEPFQSVPMEDNPIRHARSQSPDFLLDTSMREGSEEDLSIMQFFNGSGLASRLKHEDLSADRMFPLFVHLLCESHVPDICLLFRFVDILSDPNDTSERAYYFTTLGAAIAMVCEVGGVGIRSATLSQN